MHIVDYDYVIGFGQVEFDILYKLLEGEEELTDDEERRAAQMARTITKVEKIRANKKRLNRTRGVHVISAPSTKKDHDDDEYVEDTCSTRN